MKMSLLNSENIVVNVVIAGPNWPVPDGLTVGPEGGEIGDHWDGERYIGAAELQATDADFAAEPPPTETYIADPLHTEALLSLQNQVDELKAQPPTIQVISDSGSDVAHLQARLDEERAARLTVEAKLDAVTKALSDFSLKQEGGG